MSTNADDLVQAIVDLLTHAPDRPQELAGDGKILDHDLLPVEEDDLPVLGIYLADDKRVAEENSVGGHERIALVRVEIRAQGHMLKATRILREWAIRTILFDPDLADLVNDISFAGFTPFGAASNKHLAGADLDFEATYYYDPSEES